MTNKSRYGFRQDPCIGRSHNFHNLRYRERASLQRPCGYAVSARRAGWQDEIRSETTPEMTTAFDQGRALDRSRSYSSKTKFPQRAYALEIESRIRKNAVRDQDSSRAGEGD